MRTNVWAYVGRLTLPKCLLFFSLLAILVTPALAQNSYWSQEFNQDTGVIGGGLGIEVIEGGIDYAHYNTSMQMQDKVAPNTTPWELWIGSGLLGLILFLYSLRPVKSMDELESSIIVAAMSVVSFGYCSLSSFNVDRITGFGVSSNIVNQTSDTLPVYNHEYVYMEQHLIYSEPVIGILMAVLFFVAIGYTLYRVSKHRAWMNESGDSE